MGELTPRTVNYGVRAFTDLVERESKVDLVAMVSAIEEKPTKADQCYWAVFHPDTDTEWRKAIEGVDK